MNDMAGEEDFGKSIGKDLEEGIMTLPLIYTPAKCSETKSSRVQGAIQCKAFKPDKIYPSAPA